MSTKSEKEREQQLFHACGYTFVLTSSLSRKTVGLKYRSHFTGCESQGKSSYQFIPVTNKLIRLKNRTVPKFVIFVNLVPKMTFGISYSA